MFSFDRIQRNHPKNVSMLMNSARAGDVGDDFLMVLPLPSRVQSAQ